MVRELLRHLGAHIPQHEELRVEAPESLSTLSSVQADVLLGSLRRHGNPMQGIVVDVQLERDTARRYLWPLMASALRAQLRCPVVLCVVTPHRTMARWAAIPIRLGAGNVWHPTVLGPAAIPAITDPVRAARLPELAILSALTHGRGLDQERAARVAAAALAACEQLELAQCQHYAGLVRSSLAEPAAKLLHEMGLDERHSSHEDAPHAPP